MPSDQETLNRWQSIASIAASIAVPIVLAIFGYFVQQSLSSDDLKKEYVQIAIDVLKENPTSQDKELRSWAIDVLDENSPIPFSKNVRNSLTTESPLVIHRLIAPIASSECMEPPNELKLNKLLEERIKGGVLDLSNPKDFLLALANEAHKAQLNTIKLKCLQDTISGQQKIFDANYKASKDRLENIQK